MLLYWGMFTVGFTIGAVLSFITFAAKTPEAEHEVLEGFSKENEGSLGGKVADLIARPQP